VYEHGNVVNGRQPRIDEIAERLSDRRLYYFGGRGTDCWPLLELEQFARVFAQCSPLGSSAKDEMNLETERGYRLELDTYSIDSDTSADVELMRQRLLEVADEGSAIATYKPTRFTDNVCYAASNPPLLLGNWSNHQLSFDYKPWVETQLRPFLQERDVRAIEWKYVPDADLESIRKTAKSYPIVLRSSKTSGGSGLTVAHTPEEVPVNSRPHADGLVAVSRFLAPSTSLNVGACVFPSGELSLHAPSVQLVGVPSCTSRPFGYCGNDFASVRDLDTAVLDQFQILTEVVGAWLHRHGYVGAFGVDGLVHQGNVYFVELNPRFQGSSSLSAELDRDIDRSDIFLEHVAAFLGLPAAAPVQFVDLISEQAPAAQVVSRNATGAPVVVGEVPAAPAPAQLRQYPKSGYQVAPEAMLGQLVFPGSVTSDGTSLTQGAEAAVARVVGG
jgi:hypothetical protein